MSRSSEDVLLVVKNVRNKKTDGSLYLMSERIAWMQNSKDSFSLSYVYSDIKLQKISPDSKDKVQLQLVFHDGGANTFHFNNPSGRVGQIADRDGVKEILQQLLPKFRRKISGELEQKNRILQDQPELFQLYKDLVVSQVITAEEFWAQRADKLLDTNQTKNKQGVGISAAFLADIKPQTDGCNGLKYNLTSDVIDSIFRTYPMVKQKHAEYVGHTLTESEFWTRFFQSHYFHRDRVNAGNKDLFAECAVQDEEVVKAEISRRVDDPLLNLRDNTDSLTGQGYGATSAESNGNINSVNLNLIRRFNHHSTMILKTCETSTNHPSPSIAQPPNHSDSTANHSIPNDSPQKKARLLEKLQYDDLQSDVTDVHSSLALTNTNRYLHGPTPLTTIKYTTSDDVINATHAVRQQIKGWNPTQFSGVPASTAVTILGELSPGGTLMTAANHATQQMVGEDLRGEIQHLYHALSELLRHFWACFPASTKDLELKVIKMRSTLERFETAKLRRVNEKLISQHYTTNLTSHLEEMLQTAYDRYNSWQARRSARK